MNPRQCVGTQLFLVFYSTDTTALRPGCFILLSGFRSALQGIPPIGTRVVDVLHITVENKRKGKGKIKKKLLHSGGQRMLEGRGRTIYIKGLQLFAVGHQHAERVLKGHP